jgi:hypothetical protein
MANRVHPVIPSKQKGGYDKWIANAFVANGGKIAPRASIV